MRRNKRAVLLTCLFTGCAVPTADPPAPLATFVAASRFVPGGMVSFAFLRDWPTMGLRLGKPERQVWAGRDFEVRGEGLGPSRSIWIADFGPRGVDATMLASMHEAKPDVVAIGAQTCWHSPPKMRNAPGSETWGTIVEDRFVVIATHRDVLAAALPRPGSVATMLAPFGDLAFVPPDATALIFSLPRSGALGMRDQLVPEEPMVFAVSPEPRRLTVFSRRPLEADYRTVLGGLWAAPSPPVRQVGVWLCQGERLRGPAELPEQTFAFTMLFLFGYRIVI